MDHKYLFSGEDNKEMFDKLSGSAAIPELQQVILELVLRCSKLEAVLFGVNPELPFASLNSKGILRTAPASNAERKKKWREKHGEIARVKERQYLRAWRANKQP